MLDLSPPTIPAEHHAQRACNAYLVHGAVHEISGQAENIDGDLLDKLIQRRLKRLERVLSAHGGTLVKLLGRGLLASFRSPEAALIGACEMQRRCAAIPQLADTQMALKIGIHATMGKRLTPHTMDPAEATAARLSELLGESGIVISETVIEGLPSGLQEKFTPVANEGSAIAAYSVDWNAIPMQNTPLQATNEHEATEKHTSLRDARIVLRQGTRRYNFDSRQHVISFGRDPSCDMAIGSPKVSRQHCRIIYHQGHYVLVDLSTNGTYVYFEDGQEIRGQKSMLQLSGKGRISFGQGWQDNSPHSFAFEIITPT
ncbi:MAG: FHA domain-containing protein [Betaproteobacteria bacterium]|nr:FHA domain-containing protein [Betaproteobacteria bacterium]